MSRSSVYRAMGRGGGRSCPYDDLWPANQCAINDKIPLFTYKKKILQYVCQKKMASLLFFNIHVLV